MVEKNREKCSNPDEYSSDYDPSQVTISIPSGPNFQEFIELLRGDPPRHPNLPCFKPSIKIPENIKPKGLVRARMLNVPSWINAISRVDRDPSKHEWMPPAVVQLLQIDEKNGFLVQILPPIIQSNPMTGQFIKVPFGLTLGLSNAEGILDTNPDISIETANRQAAAHHLGAVLGNHLGWSFHSKIIGSGFKGAYFESPVGFIAEVATFAGSAVGIHFREIPENKIAAFVAEIEKVISVAGDLSIQMMVKPGRLPKLTQNMDFPAPRLVDTGKNNQPRLGLPDGLVSGFDASLHKVEVSGFSLDDMGGNQEVKGEINKLIALFSHPDHFRKYGAQPPRGTIFFGPPGTGKTLAAKIVASSLGVPFYEYSSSDLVSVWAGESPKIVRAIFQTPTPCVVFFDEIDAIARYRETLNSIEKEIMQELLKLMGGPGSNENLIVMAATNNIDLIDAAILRNGRFDRKILVDMPDEKARREIFSIHLRSAARGSGELLFVDPIDVVAETLSHKEFSDGFSGADIAEVLRRSVMGLAALTLTDPGRAISLNDLREAIQAVKHEKHYRSQGGMKHIGFVPSVRSLGAAS